MLPNGANSGERGSLSGDTRGQTLQDYITGVVLMLVVVVFVLGLFPNFLSPFDAGVSGAERAQADRVADTLTTNLSVESGRNTLNATTLRGVVNLSQERLRERYALPETVNVNITVRELDGNDIVSTASGVPLATSQNRKNNTAAAASRVITLDNGRCRPGCRLVVKVW